MNQGSPKTLRSYYVQHKPLEIYVFIDPFCLDCWSLNPIIKKLQIQYGDYFTLKHVLCGKLTALNDCKTMRKQKASQGGFGSDDHLSIPHLASISIKAAELQGKKPGFRFMRRLQELLFLEYADVTDINVLQRCAKYVDLDINEFIRDLYSSSAAKAFQCDLRISAEMDVNNMPSLVFFNENIEDEGIKVDGLYPYDIYVQILTEMLEECVQPAELPPIEMFLAENPVVATQDLATIYNLPTQKIERKMKKLQLQQKVQKVQAKRGTFWKYVACN